MQPVTELQIAGFAAPDRQAATAPGNRLPPRNWHRACREAAMDAAALAPYADPLAAAFVLGGTVVALLIRTPPGDLGRAVRALATLGRRPFSAEEGLDQIAALGRIAKRHGVMTLDRSRIADPDIADAIAAIVDGMGPEGSPRRCAIATKPVPNAIWPLPMCGPPSPNWRRRWAWSARWSGWSGCSWR
ncbi:hypothetical protein ACVOMT_05165 [Sphingomonas panni]